MGGGSIAFVLVIIKENYYVWSFVTEKEINNIKIGESILIIMTNIIRIFHNDLKVSLKFLTISVSQWF